MDKYEMILESLQEKVDSGELTLEDAEVLNQAAYDKYVVESEDDVEEDDALTLEEAMDIISTYIEEKSCVEKDPVVAKKVLTDSEEKIKADKGLPKKVNVKESVEEARLNVYEAFESGSITEDEKNTFLQYLDLNNYE